MKICTANAAWKLCGAHMIAHCLLQNDVPARSGLLHVSTRASSLRPMHHDSQHQGIASSCSTPGSAEMFWLVLQHAAPHGPCWCLQLCLKRRDTTRNASARTQCAVVVELGGYKTYVENLMLQPNLEARFALALLRGGEMDGRHYSRDDPEQFHLGQLPTNFSLLNLWFCTTGQRDSGEPAPGGLRALHPSARGRHPRHRPRALLPLSRRVLQPRRLEPTRLERRGPQRLAQVRCKLTGSGTVPAQLVRLRFWLRRRPLTFVVFLVVQLMAFTCALLQD